MHINIPQSVKSRALLPCLVAASLLGQAPAGKVKQPVFLAPEMTDVSSILTPPPALESRRMAKDLAELFVIQRTRTPQEIQHAKDDDAHEDIFAFHTVLGDKFNPESLPATEAFWKDLSNDLGIVVTAAKRHFQQPRPYDVDGNIKPVCKGTPGGPRNSYPSGHATTGYLSAMILSMIVPEKQQELIARADDYGHSRMVCGVHYAADLRASKDAAEMIIGGMMGNPRFQKELAAAKAEIRSALGLS